MSCNCVAGELLFTYLESLHIQHGLQAQPPHHTRTRPTSLFPLDSRNSTLCNLSCPSRRLLSFRNTMCCGVGRFETLTAGIWLVACLTHPSSDLYQMELRRLCAPYTGLQGLGSCCCLSIRGCATGMSFMRDDGGCWMYMIYVVSHGRFETITRGIVYARTLLLLLPSYFRAEKHDGLFTRTWILLRRLVP